MHLKFLKHQEVTNYLQETLILVADYQNNSQLIQTMVRMQQSLLEMSTDSSHTTTAAFQDKNLPTTSAQQSNRPKILKKRSSVLRRTTITISMTHKAAQKPALTKSTSQMRLRRTKISLFQTQMCPWRRITAWLSSAMKTSGFGSTSSRIRRCPVSGPLGRMLMGSCICRRTRLNFQELVGPGQLAGLLRNLQKQLTAMGGNTQSISCRPSRTSLDFSTLCAGESGSEFA